jgi:DNA-binding SARP family transcriptional activator
MAELRFELLGPVRARRDPAELDLGSPQQRAVLAALLLARGRHVSVGTLIDALWGERAPRTAPAIVRTYVSRLRHCLQPEPGGPDSAVIRLVGDGYTLLLGSAALDLDDFERLSVQARAARADHETARAAGLFHAAQALWQGVPLAGIPGPYADTQRARLTELRVAVTEDGLAAEIDTGGHTGAIAQLWELQAEYPLRERLSELLMLALYRAGRQAEALDVFDKSRRLLVDELGIEPGPSLRDMHQRILQADGRLVGLPTRPVQAHRRLAATHGHGTW